MVYKESDPRSDSGSDSLASGSDSISDSLASGSDSIFDQQLNPLFLNTFGESDPGSDSLASGSDSGSDSLGLGSVETLFLSCRRKLTLRILQQ